MNNSYLYIDKELETFKLDENLVADDYMQTKDISWVAQVLPLIEQFSKEGDIVFDPFAGLGTTLLGASISGRKSIGIEIEQHRFCQLKKRIDSYKHQLKTQPLVIYGDALQIDYPREVDLIVTNFPYFHASPNLDSGNLYSLDNYTAYLNMIEEIIIKCKNCLKKGGYMLVFSENLRLANGNMIPQAYDVCLLLQKYFNLKEERIILYNKPYSACDDITFTNRSHEYVFVAKQTNEHLNRQVYSDVLQDLNNSIEYVTVGTYALLYHPERVVMDNPPNDLDIFVVNVTEAIKVGKMLRNKGFDIFSWEDLLTDSFDHIKLTGRYYLRAIKKIDNLIYTIDIVYQSDIVNFDWLKQNSLMVDNIPIANIKAIMTLLQNRNSDKDKSLMFRIKNFRKNNETI